jgi:sugar phosphate isomerase/epimerase
MSPTSFFLWQEAPIGQEKVDFPAIIAKLKQIGYKYPVAVEREIRGAQEEADLRGPRKLCWKSIG